MATTWCSDDQVIENMRLFSSEFVRICQSKKSSKFAFIVTIALGTSKLIIRKRKGLEKNPEHYTCRSVYSYCLKACPSCSPSQKRKHIQNNRHYHSLFKRNLISFCKLLQETPSIDTFEKLFVLACWLLKIPPK